MADNQEFEASRGMPAVREVVFGYVSDPENVARWVPDLGEVHQTGDTTLHVQGDVGGEHVDADGVFDVRPEQFRVEWGNRPGAADGAYSGWLQVHDAAVGTSEVVLHLSFVGMAAPPGLQQSLEQALDQLAQEVGSKVDDAS